MKRAISLLTAVGIALAGIPVAAQDLPNSIFGTVPGGLEGVANAVLLDASGKTLSTAPVTEGRFAFRSVSPGNYFVGLLRATGTRVARSCEVILPAGAQKEASFDCPPPAAAVPPKEGLGTTGWVLIGAAAAGITTAVVIATDEDQGPASPSR